MAQLVSYTIPSLIQGTSQQPDAQRDPTQAEIQINAVSSIAEGLRKRDSTHTLARVSTTPFGDAFIHTILRDNTEEYLAVITKTVIRVFDLQGGEKTVNAPGGYGYLASVTDARQQIRSQSIADYTFILNTNTAVAMNPALAPATPRPKVHEALVWVRAANYGQEYKVNVNGTEAKVTTAVAPVVSSGTSVTENRISSANIAESLRLTLTGGPVTTFTQALFPTKLSGTKTALPTTSSGLGSGIKVDVVGDGTNATAVTMSTAGTAYVVGDKVFVAKYLLEGGSDSTPVEVGQVGALGPAPLSGVTITRSGSVLWVQSDNPITLAASDARANADITAILGEVQAFTELPTIAPKGYQVEITGDPGNNFDGYYVSFTPKSGDFGEGTWSETVSPGVEYKVDESTMPHLLIRLPDGTFYFGPANGSTQGTVTIPAWGQRTTGDYHTAPDPSFIGHPINDVFIYKNRLGFLADENVILSRVREFFEFFPETVTTVLDTDPIDVVASNNRVSVLRYAVPYQDELILFSAQYQFRFNAAETVLTPKTAQITVLTQFEVDTTVRPQQAGGGIIFCQVNAQWSQFREFSVRGAGTALTADASDLTGYVSAYIPSGIFKMTVNDTGNSLFAISGKAGYEKRIYTYKWYFRNTGQGAERAQSSWSHWEFSGVDEVLQVICIRETLYCLMRYGQEVYLEMVPVMDRMASTSGVGYPLLLDRRVSTTTATPVAMRMAKGVYDAVTNKTTFTLPYEVKGKTELWSGTAGPVGLYGLFSAGVRLGEATSGNTIVARGNWSAAEVYAGEPYEFRYRFTRFKMMREIGGGKAAVNAMRTQVRSAKLRFHETGYFQVHVLPEHRSEGVYRFDGATSAVRGAKIGAPALLDSSEPQYSEGVFNIPILSRGEQCAVEIRNSTPHPCKFSTCEWVALVTGRARSLQ